MILIGLQNSHLLDRLGTHCQGGKSGKVFQPDMWQLEARWGKPVYLPGILPSTASALRLVPGSVPTLHRPGRHKSQSAGSRSMIGDTRGIEVIFPVELYLIRLYVDAVHATDDNRLVGKVVKKSTGGKHEGIVNCLTDTAGK